MQYLASFPCRSLAAPSWRTVTWQEHACWCDNKLVEAPELAHLSRISPTLFRIDLQQHEGRIYVQPERLNAEYPCLPGHVELMQLFRDHARELFVDPALVPAPPSTSPTMALSPDLRIGNLYLCPEWGSLDPVPSPYLPVTAQGTCVYYNRHLPYRVLSGPTLVVVPELSVLQWQEQYPELQMLREGYNDSVHLHLMTVEDLAQAVQQLQQAVPAHAFSGPTYHLPIQDALALGSGRDAADLAQFPLVHCWRMQWQALWLDHCPQDKYALVMPILRRETILLERQVLPAPPLAVQQQQALLLGVPYPQVYSPWLSVELHRVQGSGRVLPALRPVQQHWCHLPRAWHGEYVRQPTILGKLQVGLGDGPNHIRIVSPTSCLQHWQGCSRKRKRQTLPGQQAFVETQIAALGETCTICLEQATTTLFRCGHATCLACAQRCLQVCGKCPQCRHTLNTPSCTYHVTALPLSAAVVRQVYGGKIAAVWELLHGWGTRAKVVLVGQITAQAQRRLATVLRQLHLPCQCLLGPRKLQELADFRDGTRRLLLLRPGQLAGLLLPTVEYVVYLHALLDVDHRIERGIQGVFGTGTKFHSLNMRNTVEELLAFPPPHASDMFARSV